MDFFYLLIFCFSIASNFPIAKKAAYVIEVIECQGLFMTNVIVITHVNVEPYEMANVHDKTRIIDEINTEYPFNKYV